MKKTSKFFLFGVLAIALLIPAILVGAAPNSSGLQQEVTPTPSAAPADQGPAQAPAVGGTPTSPVVELWDQFCVKKVPYTLLAVPENATFEVVALADDAVMPTPNPNTGNTNEIVCTSSGIFRGKQVITCRGPELWSFNLTITDGGQSGEFPVPLKACPAGPFIPDSAELPAAPVVPVP